MTANELLKSASEPEFFEHIPIAISVSDALLPDQRMFFDAEGQELVAVGIDVPRGACIVVMSRADYAQLWRFVRMRGNNRITHPCNTRQ